MTCNHLIYALNKHVTESISDSLTVWIYEEVIQLKIKLNKIIVKVCFIIRAQIANTRIMNYSTSTFMLGISSPASLFNVVIMA